MVINGLTPSPARRKFHFAGRLKTETAAGIRGDLIPPVSSNEALVRTTSAKAKSSSPLLPVIAATKELWHQYHLTYDQTHDVAKEVRRALPIERPNTRKSVVARLSRDEERKLIAHAYRTQGTLGLLVKALFQTGARVPEFVNIRAEEFFSDEQIQKFLGHWKRETTQIYAESSPEMIKERQQRALVG
jgi:site-specific recombinase XerD